MLPVYDTPIERLPEGIKHLKKETHIYLYGDGGYARKALDELQRWKIMLDGVVVSSEYYTNARFGDWSVTKFEELMEKDVDAVTIVAGYNVLFHKELNNRILSYAKVKNLYVLNGCETLFGNGFNWLWPRMELVDSYYEGLLKRDLNPCYYHDNIIKFEETYDWLEDEKSRRTMELYLEGHITLKAFPMLEVWRQEDVADQYFADDIVKLTDEEIFVDCGAYTGDTLENFSRRVRAFRKYYALEPDGRQFEALDRIMLKTANLGRVLHIRAGVWDKKGKIGFSQENACGEICAEMNKDLACIAADSIDNIVDGKEKVTFIKMDIEGAELPALHGARKTISRDKPKLAICVYHKREDLITIPQFVKELVPEYRLYLRCHFPYASELVLYAV